MFPAGEGGASRFLGFPGRLLSTLEMAGIVTLLAYLVYVGGPLWRLWGWGGIVAAFAAMATVAYYAIVYDAYARANQEAALATLLPEALPRARRARAWSVVSARAAALAGRVRPNCGTPMRGADLIRGHAYLESDHAYTETEVPLFSRAPVASLKQEDVSWFGIENGVPGLGRGAYVLALLLAIAAPVVLVLRSRGTPALRRLAAACRAGSMVLWLYVVNSAFASSFALVVFLSGSKGKGDAELLGTLTKTADGAGLIPLIVVGAAFFCACGVLWTRAWNADRRDGGQRWPQLRGRLAIVLLPHAVLGVAFVVTSAIGVGLWGLAAHFAGVSLLALGFGRVDDELRAAPPPAAPAPPVLAGGQPAPG
jgi:hypothetical protein